MGGELGNENYIDLLVSSALCTPIFSLIENDDIINYRTSKCR